MKRYAEGDFIILLLYVDDMLIVGNGTKRIALLKKALSKSFAMKDLGSAKQIVGMNISLDRSKRLLLRGSSQLTMLEKQYLDRRLLERSGLRPRFSSE
jgi:hypothetical protein